EDQLWFHVGWSLQNAGFCMYPKTQVAGFARQHVDAVALHREYRCVVVIEAKRLYSPEKHGSLGDDWVRLQRIKLPCEWLPFPHPINCYALLLGSCWSNEFMRWWTTTPRAEAPAGSRRSQHWHELRAALESSTRTGAVDVQRPGWQPQWICYSLNKLPDDHW